MGTTILRLLAAFTGSIGFLILLVGWAAPWSGGTLMLGGVVLGLASGFFRHPVRKVAEPQRREETVPEVWLEACDVLEDLSRFATDLLPNVETDVPIPPSGECGEEAFRLHLERARRILASPAVRLLRHGMPAAENFYESYHKLPYLRRFIVNAIEKTEAATLTVIERFAILKNEIDRAAKESGAFMDKLRGTSSGGDYHRILEDLRVINTAFEDQVAGFDRFSKSVGTRFDSISRGVEQIAGMLDNIVEISEQNNVISINSSIEASKLGRQGAGFKVLVGEILKSNEKTQQFIQEINRIITELRESNDAAVNAWQNETRHLEGELKSSQEKAQAIIGALGESYRQTGGIFLGLGTNLARMQEQVGKVLTALQFQDITRQQLENVMQFIEDIEFSIASAEEFFQSQGKNLHAKDPRVLEKIRGDFLRKAKVIDEKLILEEIPVQ